MIRVYSVKHPNNHTETFFFLINNIISAQQLIRMLNFFLGNKVFQLSINNYLLEVALKNSNLHQLWVTFSKIAVKSKVQLQGLTIEGIMNSWITQKGFPLIIVTVEREKNRVLIEQVIIIVSFPQSLVVISSRYINNYYTYYFQYSLRYFRNDLCC